VSTTRSADDEAGKADAAGAPQPGGGESPGIPASAVEPWILGRLQGLTGDAGGPLIDELLDMFEREAPAALTALADAAGRGESARLEREAHTLKGFALTVGASGMAALCARLEALAKGTAGGSASAAIDELRAAYPSTLIRLRAAADARG
jgi:HPt (histidine-containing phosphotransfer) domain-containing protein